MDDERLLISTWKHIIRVLDARTKHTAKKKAKQMNLTVFRINGVVQLDATDARKKIAAYAARQAEAAIVQAKADVEYDRLREEGYDSPTEKLVDEEVERKKFN